MSIRRGACHLSTVGRFLVRGKITVCSATRRIVHAGGATSSGSLRIIRPSSLSNVLHSLPSYATMLATKRLTAGIFSGRFNVERGPRVKKFIRFRFRGHGFHLCHVPDDDETCPVTMRGGTRCCQGVFGSVLRGWRV